MLYRNLDSQEAIDAEYNPMLTVDGPAAIGQYHRDSDATRQQLTHHRHAFGPTRAEYLDLFPADTPDAPIHVFFHGGYWRALAADDFAFVARALVPRGVTTVVVNYALCPSVTLGEIVRQCRAALAWVYRTGADGHGDQQRISVSGHSAGGQIVGMLQATDWAGVYNLPNDLIRSGTAISGLFDLRPFPFSWLQPKLQLTGRDVQDYSPLFQSAPSTAPMRLWVGEQESSEFHRQARAYADHLRHDNPERRVETGALPGCHHFSVLDGFNTGQGPLFEALMADLDG